MSTPYKTGMMVQACNLGTQEVEIVGSGVRGHSQIHTEFKTRVGCEILSQKHKSTARCGDIHL